MPKGKKRNYQSKAPSLGAAIALGVVLALLVLVLVFIVFKHATYEPAACLLLNIKRKKTSTSRSRHTSRESGRVSSGSEIQIQTICHRYWTTLRRPSTMTRRIPLRA